MFGTGVVIGQPVNFLNATELFIFRCLILCEMAFTSINYFLKFR